MTAEELLELIKRKRDQEWWDTELGAAFIRFENALTLYLQGEAYPRISDQGLRKLRSAAGNARKDLLMLIRGW